MERKEFNKAVKEIVSLLGSFIGKKAVEVTEKTFRDGKGYVQLHYDVCKIDDSVDLDWDISFLKKMDILQKELGAESAWFGNRMMFHFRDE